MLWDPQGLFRFFTGLFLDLKLNVPKLPFAVTIKISFFDGDWSFAEIEKPNWSHPFKVTDLEKRSENQN